MKKLLLFGALAFGLNAFGQDVVFKFTNDTQLNYNIANISKITFDGNETNLHFSDNNIFTLSNVDLLNYFYDFTAGYTENTEPPINIYPNPSNGHITIQTEYKKNTPFMIYDEKGKKVMAGKLNEDNTKISLNNLPKGIYFIHIGGELMSRTIVIND
jgi:hypothetical protein